MLHTLEINENGKMNLDHNDPCGDQVLKQMMIDTIPTLAWSCLTDGSAEFFNHRWFDYTGLELDDLLGWRWKVAIHPDDLERLIDTWLRIFSCGEPGEEEARLRRFDGEYHWFLFRAMPVYDEHGKIVRWCGTNTDIEALKRADEHRVALQDELAAERDRLRLVLEVSRALLSKLELPNLFRALAESVRRVTDCDFIGLALPDSVTGELRQHLVHYDESRGAIIEGMVVPLHGSATGKAFRTGELVRIDYGQANPPDPEIYHTPEGEQYYQALLREGIPTGYFLPLIHDDQVIGVMQLMKYSAPEAAADATAHALKDQEAEFLRALAGQLSIAVANALEHRSVVASRDLLAREQVYLREEIERSSMFEEVVGSSKALMRVLSEVRRVAPTDSTVLILGESGTGKELIARAIHKRSSRSKRPFIPVNCAAIPSSLIASELFGYEKGAFTGALQRRLGRFESAHEGTIFLDEVGELPMKTQVALLRVLQERELERIGGSQSIPVDVRVLAATNRDLSVAMAKGTFREDLFYRLNVFPIEIPSLRDRADDIPLLVEYFLVRHAAKCGKRFRKIERKTLDLFQRYDWPGNIRELQNVLERAVIVCDGETLSVSETWLKQQSPRKPWSLSVSTASPLRRRENEEREMIEAALEESNGRISGPFGAAHKLGIPRQTLESKIAAMGIDKYRFKSLSLAESCPKV